jgi:hypothetical protein
MQKQRVRFAGSMRALKISSIPGIAFRIHLQFFITTSV